jgi:thymidylate synthase ThyX
MNGFLHNKCYKSVVRNSHHSSTTALNFFAGFGTRGAVKMVLKYNSISAREFVEREIPDGNTPLLFSGIGAFRGRTDYTQSEATVLDYFFTSTTSNVYAARDALPNELWALLMGQFARSNMTARDRVLKLFGDVHKKGARDGKSVPSIDEMARSIKSGGEMEGMILEVADAALALNSVDLGNIARRMGDLAALFDTNSLMAEHLRRSGVFIEEWGINYGHASLRDSGVIRLCIEGISQRSTKKVEAARQGAYQEQSTRALPFTIGNAGIPYEIRETPFEGILLQLNQDSITLYDKIAERLPAYLKHKLIYLRHEADEKLRCARGQVSKPVPDGIWNRVINEKVFDVARYLLPQNMTTSLGITLNARRFQDMLTEWQSDPLYEVRMIGRVAQAESIKISPVLMKHGNKSEFYEALPGRRKEVYDKLIGPVYSPNERRDISTKLSKCTPEIETMVLASILLNARPDLTYADLIARVRQMNAQDRILIAEAEMKDRKSYEALPKGAEVGSI